MDKIRVLLADDHAIVRAGIRQFLESAGDIEVVGEAGNGLEAVRMTEALQPDVILMDLEMPVIDGYEAARQIKTCCPDCRVVALTVHEYEAARQQAFQAGMDAFIVKGAPLETLLQTIYHR